MPDEAWGALDEWWRDAVGTGLGPGTNNRKLLAVAPAPIGAFLVRYPVPPVPATSRGTPGIDGERPDAPCFPVVHSEMVQLVALDRRGVGPGAALDSPPVPLPRQRDGRCPPPQGMALFPFRFASVVATHRRPRSSLRPPPTSPSGGCG